jgi:hypothetical protein
MPGVSVDSATARQRPRERCSLLPGMRRQTKAQGVMMPK